MLNEHCAESNQSTGVFRLAYVSVATDAMTGEAMKQLEQQSQSRNAELNITGLLIVHEGRILQILEGSESQVRWLFSKIAMDSRHREVRQFAGESVTESMLHSWSMVAGEISNAPEEVKASFREMHQRFSSAVGISGISTGEIESLKMISLFQALSSCV